jgi:DNA-directed RNA polymerase specialized sigma24 family protein
MPDQRKVTESVQADLPAIHFVLGMVGDHFEADDIVPETALKAFMHFTEFRGEAKPRGCAQRLQSASAVLAE